MSRNIKPVVSVCIITYNHELLIRQAIDGVLNQICKYSFDVIIGEDFSSDSTRRICEEYQQKYPEIIKILPAERNLGMMPNFIRTLKACTGRYIALCEGDDFWTDPYKLNKQIDLLEQYESCSACFTNAIRKNEFNGSERVFLNGLEEGYVQKRTLILRGGAYYPTASLVFKTNQYIFDVFNKIDELAGDNLLIMILAMQGDVFFLNQITCVYRVWEGGIYSSTINDKKKTITRIKKTVVGLKKLFNISENKYKKDLKDRISIESLLILESENILKNRKYILYLNIKDLLRLFLFNSYIIRSLISLFRLNKLVK